MKLLAVLIFTSSLYAQADLAQIAKEYTEQNIQKVNSPGVIVGVVQNNKLIFSKAFGKKDINQKLPVTKDTLFRIGSITKTFTGMALMILRDRGLISFDDHVEEYIPSLNKLKYPYLNAPKISLMHLLTHTSGLIRHPQPKDISIEGLIEELINPTLTKSSFIDSTWYPGYKYRYSNIGISLLGEVVKRVSGQPIARFIKDEILTPLKMNNTYWQESEIPTPLRSYGYKWNTNKWTRLKDWDLRGYSAAGSMYSNIGDMAKWISLQFNINPTDSPIISNPFSINEMSRAQRMFTNSDKKKGVAITWHTDNTTIGSFNVGHNGKTYGYRSSLSFDKEKKIGVIIMANHAEADVSSFGYGLLSKLQKSLNSDHSNIFSKIKTPLLKVLQGNSTLALTDVFDKGLFNYYGQSDWEIVIQQIADQYGQPEKILNIKGISPSQSILTIKTSKGILEYILTISSSEKNRLSGILTSNFHKDNIK